MSIAREKYKIILMFIKNFGNLATTPQRKVVLELIEEALSSIQAENILSKNITLSDNILGIKDKSFNLSQFKRIFIIGFGKGSAKNAKFIEEKLGNKLTAGFVIDTNLQGFAKIEFTKGTHPLPSQVNIDFTKNVLKNLANLSPRDLVIVVISGGGSALFENPYRVSLEELKIIDDALLKSGADITEMNTVRKHLSLVKGGGLAKALYPATVVSVISSDVPGNNLSVISSGPTVKDPTTIDDATGVLEKYNIEEYKEHLTETPKEDKYFENVFNILILTSLTALDAMRNKADKLGYRTEILSDKFEGVARNAGQELIQKTKPGSILLVGGETTVKVTGGGQGGRNQEVVLGALLNIDDKTTIASFDSDGWDNYVLAGAIGDSKTLEKAMSLHLDPLLYLNRNDSLEFFEKVGDGIETGRLPSNVSDLIIVFKN